MLGEKKHNFLKIFIFYGDEIIRQWSIRRQALTSAFILPAPLRSENADPKCHVTENFKLLNGLRASIPCALHMLPVNLVLCRVTEDVSVSPGARMMGAWV